MRCFKALFFRDNFGSFFMWLPCLLNLCEDLYCIVEEIGVKYYAKLKPNAGVPMDRQQIGLMLAIHELEHPLKLDTFEDRLILQKLIYLAQAYGLDLGYPFRWYLRGPYSPALTRDAFRLASDLAAAEAESSRWALDKNSGEQLKRLKTSLPTTKTPSRAEKLELLASVHYMVKERDIPSTDTNQLAKALEVQGKGHLAGGVSKAVEELNKHGFFGGSPSPKHRR